MKVVQFLSKVSASDYLQHIQVRKRSSGSERDMQYCHFRASHVQRGESFIARGGVVYNLEGKNTVKRCSFLLQVCMSKALEREIEIVPTWGK